MKGKREKILTFSDSLSDSVSELFFLTSIIMTALFSRWYESLLRDRNQKLLQGTSLEELKSNKLKNRARADMFPENGQEIVKC